MTNPTRAVRTLRRRIVAVVALRQSLLWTAWWCLLWGIAALVSHILAPRIDARWGWVAVPILIAAAIVSAWRSRPSDDALLALLDSRGHCGGLVMASGSATLGAWEAPLAEGDVPQVRWSAAKTIALACASLAFVTGALVIPRRVAQQQTRLDVTPDVERLQQRVDILKEEKILTDDRAETMERALDDLQRNAAGDDPAKAFETLDSIDEATVRAAREAAEASLQKAEALTKVEAMSAVLDGGGLDPAQVASGMRELADQTEQAAKEAGEMIKGLSPELQKAIANKSLTGNDLKAIAAAAKMGKEQLRKALEKLGASGMIDPKTLRDFDQKADFGNRDELARYLKKQGSQTRLGEGVAQWVQGGEPGVSRGRGDAPMFFGEQSDEAGAKFKEETLPDAAAASLADSSVLGVSAGAPESDPKARASGSGGLSSTQGGAGSAFTPTVLPRHRGTVQRFFERKKQ